MGTLRFHQVCFGGKHSGTSICQLSSLENSWRSGLTMSLPHFSFPKSYLTSLTEIPTFPWAVQSGPWCSVFPWRRRSECVDHGKPVLLVTTLCGQAGVTAWVTAGSLPTLNARDSTWGHWPHGDDFLKEDGVSFQACLQL